MRRLIGAAAALLLGTAPLAASDDELIDALLADSAITWPEAAWLVGRSVGTFDESVTPADAALEAGRLGWAAPGLRPERMTLTDYSFLLARSHGISGGLFYSLFPDGRYALRELVYRRILPVGLDPDTPVSGQDALVYLQNAENSQKDQGGSQ